jgi:hypothetical protein
MGDDCQANMRPLEVRRIAESGLILSSTRGHSYREQRNGYQMVLIWGNKVNKYNSTNLVLWT